MIAKRRELLIDGEIPATSNEDYISESKNSRVSNLKQLAIAVGTPVARCPPHRPGRALISASGSYLG
jgi:hypothetical protein